MKKRMVIAAALLTVLTWWNAARGDESDGNPPLPAAQRIRIQERQMIEAGVPAEEAAKLTRMMTQNRFSEQQMLKAQQSVMRASKDGLPVEPVLNKAYEGMAKQVSDDRIVQAMEATRQRYAFAHRLAGELAQDRAVRNRIGAAVAEGLAAGIRQQEALQMTVQIKQRVSNPTGDRPQEIALETFEAARVMARLGVPSAMVAGLMGSAHLERLTARELRQIGNSFMAVSSRSDAAALASRFAGSAQSGRLAQEVRTHSGAGSGAGAAGSHGSGSGSGGGAGSGADPGGGSSGGGPGGGGGAGSGGGSGSGGGGKG